MSTPPPTYPPKRIVDVLFKSTDGAVRSGQMLVPQENPRWLAIHIITVGAGAGIATLTPDRIICAV